MKKGDIVMAKQTKFGLEEGKQYDVLTAGKGSVTPTVYVVDNSGHPVQYSVHHFNLI